MSEKYRLIAADDEPGIRNGLRCFPWEKFGFALIDVVINGKKALERCEEIGGIDSVIADIRMPFMNGLELCMEVHNRWPGSKNLILTGHKDFDYAQEAIKAGVRGYLLKPVDLEELKQALVQIKAELDQENSRKEFIDPCSEIHTGLLPASLLKKPVIAAAAVYVAEHMQERIVLEQVAEQVCLNTNYFCQYFKKETGMTFIDYVRRYRIEQAKILLERVDLKIYEVGERVGMGSSRYFTDTFRELTGRTPSEYRNGIR